MKKIILLLTLALILVPFCLAGLDVKLNSYDQETKLAKIDVSNTGGPTYNGVKLQIDAQIPLDVVAILSPGSTISLANVVAPGIHNVTILTKEGETLTKEITFAKTEEQVKEETSEEQRLIEEHQKELEAKQEEVKQSLEEDITQESENLKSLEQTTPTSGKTNFQMGDLPWMYILGIAGLILLLVVGFIIFRIFSKKKSEGKPPEIQSEVPKEVSIGQIPALGESKEKPSETASLPEEPKTLNLETVGRQIKKIPQHISNTHQKIMRNLAPLRQAIIDSLKKGYSLMNIKTYAEKLGWTDEEIDKTVTELKLEGAIELIPLREAIKSAIQLHHPREQIILASQKSGWTQEQIDQAFKELGI